MSAMRHTISGSDAAEDDDIPECPRCGGLVEDPCQTDEKAQTCELPDFCFPNGRLVNGQSEIVANLRAFSSNPVAPHIMSWQQKTMTEAADEIERLRQRLAVLEMVVIEEIDECQYEANQMIVDDVRDRHSPTEQHP